MTGGDPFAPTHVVAPKAPRPTLDRPPVDRLRRLGASSIVLVELDRRWRPMNQADRRQAVVDLDALSDDELREAVVEMEVEAVATQRKVNENWLVSNAIEGLRSSPPPDGTVKEIVQWVDDQPDRALAALVVELRRPPTEQRSTLTDALEAVLG